MTNFRQFLIEDEQISRNDIIHIEKYADQLFKMVGVDVEFTKHFLDRANDPRNGRQITVSELISLFNKQFQANGKTIAKMGPDAEAVLKDMKTDINTPVVLEWIPGKNVLEMRAKTIMRKKNFTSPDRILRVS